MTILRKPRSRGQALVEFALVIPMFLLLIFGIVDIGRYVYTNNALNQAAREAARVGSVSSRPACSAGARDACVNEIARERITGFGLKPGIATSGAPGTPGVFLTCQRPNNANTLAAVAFSNCRGGDVLRVRLNHEFLLVTPLIAQFLGTQDLYGEATVTVSS